MTTTTTTKRPAYRRTPFGTHTTLSAPATCPLAETAARARPSFPSGRYDRSDSSGRGRSRETRIRVDFQRCRDAAGTEWDDDGAGGGATYRTLLLKLATGFESETRVFRLRQRTVFTRTTLPFRRQKTENFHLSISTVSPVLENYL